MKTSKKMKIYRFFDRLREWILEDQPLSGLGGPPNSWRHVQVNPTITAGDSGVEYYFAGFKNDAFEYWIGCKWKEGDEKWLFYCSTEVFRKLVIWYLWRWMWGEWFGLRRKLFYWDLSRRVKKYHWTSEK